MRFILIFLLFLSLGLLGTCGSCGFSSYFDKKPVSTQESQNVEELSPDADTDGIPWESDNCKEINNPDQSDRDKDGIGDACDNCPDYTNFDQADSDTDGIGDACETSLSPTLDNESSLCTDSIDNDRDGLIDCADSDCSNNEACAVVIPPTPPEICDDGIDNDGDGAIDCRDNDCGNENHCLTTWQKTYAGESYDYFAYSVEPTNDGGYIAVGYRYPLDGEDLDALIIKVNENGQEEWRHIYGGENNDYARSIEKTTDGGYIIAGYTNSFEQGSFDVWLIKINSIGDEEWNQTYGGEFDDAAYSVKETSDGGYIVAGYTTGERSYDVVLIKVLSNGIREWERVYNWAGNSNDYAYSVELTSDGGYIIAGYTIFFGQGGSNALLIKVDNVGEVRWKWVYGGENDDYAYAVTPASDGGYIVAGYTNSFGNGGSDAWLIKVNSLGVEEWSTIYESAHDSIAFSVKQTTDGGYIVVGYVNSNEEGNPDALLIKVNKDGHEEWRRIHGGNSNDFAHSIKQTRDGGYIVAGYTDSFGPGISDVWLIKTDRFGNAPCYEGDGDGICYLLDNCPFIANPLQEDVDRDEIGDVCDYCPEGDLGSQLGQGILTGSLEGAKDNMHTGEGGVERTYLWTAPFTGLFQFDLCGSDYNTFLSILEGNCNSDVILSNNDDFCGEASELSIELRQGSTVTILIGGYEESTGNFVLTITGQEPICPTGRFYDGDSIHSSIATYGVDIRGIAFNTSDSCYWDITGSLINDNEYALHYELRNGDIAQCCQIDAQGSILNDCNELFGQAVFSCGEDGGNAEFILTREE